VRGEGSKKATNENEKTESITSNEREVDELFIANRTIGEEQQDILPIYTMSSVLTR